MRFDGKTFYPAIDGVRLTTQLTAVFDFMSDGMWRTLKQISSEVGSPESSISARLRDLRKPRFGQYTVDRRRMSEGAGTYEYRIAA